MFSRRFSSLKRDALSWKAIQGKKLPIMQNNESVLREKARHVPVEKINSPIFQTFLADLNQTCKENKGAGIAAPQVNKAWRVFMYNPFAVESNEYQVEDDIPASNVGETESQDQLIEVINPEIIRRSPIKENYLESCLSTPNIFGCVDRSIEIQVKYYNGEGRVVEEILRGVSACVFQHEYDHLNGTLFTDYVPPDELMTKEEVDEMAAEFMQIGEEEEKTGEKLS